MENNKNFLTNLIFRAKRINKLYKCKSCLPFTCRKQTCTIFINVHLESSDGEIVEIPFTYTNWWNQEGASVDERCAHLDLRQKSAWADKDCSVLSQYFVCEQGKLGNNTVIPYPSLFLCNRCWIQNVGDVLC